MAGSSRRRRSHDEAVPMAQINIIPLVDVVLVLLIIFMATTAFIKESGLNMKLPAARTTEVSAQEDKDIDVALTKDNKIYLEGKPTTEDELRAVMTRRAQSKPQPRVIIKGDQDIPYSRVVRVMDIVKQAGLPRVSLGTRLPESGGQ